MYLQIHQENMVSCALRYACVIVYVTSRSGNAEHLILYSELYNADLPLMSNLNLHHVLHNQNSKRLSVSKTKHLN